MSRTAIEKARQVHQRHPGLAFPMDMEYLANAEGCHCLFWPLLEPVREVKWGRWIGIAVDSPLRERRYLIAHALAHHLLHCGNQLVLCDWRESCRRKQESEADCCAAHILIPEEELNRVMALPLWEIADHFGVSEEMVSKRITVFATDSEIAKWQLSQKSDIAEGVGYDDSS